MDNGNNYPVITVEVLFIAVIVGINVSTEVQKQEWLDLLYHTLHGSQMPKVKCSQWVSVFLGSL